MHYINPTFKVSTTQVNTVQIPHLKLGGWEIENHADMDQKGAFNVLALKQGQ